MDIYWINSLGLSNPVDAIYHIQPVMAAVMIFLAIGLEGKIHLFACLDLCASYHKNMQTQKSCKSCENL